MKNFKYLTPFKWCMLQSFPFIEATFDAIDNYGLLCKIVEYLDKTIIKTNETGKKVEELTNAFNNLKDYIDNYFENLDVQDEINKKLDELVADGTIAEILDGKLLNKLDINSIYENQDGIYLGAFASEYINKPNYLRFYISKDLKTFTPLANIPLEIGNNNVGSVYVPTSDIIYRNNKFYLLSGHSAGKGTIDLYVSENLKDWQLTSYDLLPTLSENVENWAPKWFEYENDLYITLCIRINNLMTPYIAKVTSLEPFTFETAVRLNLPSNIENADQIDQKAIYYNNNIYLFQRRYNSEYDHIELYKGSDLSNLIFQKTIFDNIPKIEAPYIVKSDNEFYLYADASGDGSGTFYSTSLDIENWSTPQPVNSSLALRHGSVLKINNEINEKLLLQATSFNTYLNDVFSSNKYVNLKYCVNNNVFKPLNIDNITYYIDINNEITINQIDTSEIDKINNFKIILWGESGRLNAKLKLNYGNGILIPNNLATFEFNCENALKSPIVFHNSGRKSFVFKYDSIYKDSIQNLTPEFINGTTERVVCKRNKNVVTVSFSFKPTESLPAQQTTQICSGLPKPLANMFIPCFIEKTNQSGRLSLGTNGSLATWYNNVAVEHDSLIVVNFSYFTNE